MKNKKDKIFDMGNRRCLICLFNNDDCTLTKVGKITNMTHSHIIKNCYDLKKMGYVEISEKIGRHKIVTLTKKGLILAEKLNDIESFINGGKDG